MVVEVVEEGLEVVAGQLITGIGSSSNESKASLNLD